MYSFSQEINEPAQEYIEPVGGGGEGWGFKCAHPMEDICMNGEATISLKLSHKDVGMFYFKT